jgi:hypothetical protein
MRLTGTNSKQFCVIGGIGGCDESSQNLIGGLNLFRRHQVLCRDRPLEFELP